MRRFSLLLCAAVLMWIPWRASAFGVSPAALDLSGDRGTTVNATFTLINTGTAEQTYYLRTIKFGPGDASGTPSFIPYEVDHSGLPEWIAFPHAEVSVAAHAKADVPFAVAVPSGAESGTSYGAITVSTTPSDVVATNGASVEAKTAVLVFFTVNGETTERSAVLDFVTPDGPVVTAHNLSYAFRVQNQGNVVTVPKATIAVTDLFGRTVLTKNANPSEGRVLPGTTRTFSGDLAEAPHGVLSALRAEWSLFAIGPVTATLTVEGATAAPALQIHYWMLPWHLLASVAAAILLLALAWGALRKNRR